jgi:hypothetical protein
MRVKKSNCSGKEYDRMDNNPADADLTPDALRQELARLRQRVQYLEGELANSRQALAKEFYSRLPLPYTEEELKQITAEERGVPLEDFITDLENASEGQKS